MRTYITNCQLGLKRNANYKLAEKILSKWEITNEEIDGCGNLCADLQVDSNTKIARFVYFDNRTEVERGFYAAIPSALLMYRLACLFKGNIQINGMEGYKVVWSLNLRHKKTGERLSFGEWKGGSLFWTKFHTYKKLSKTFKKDLLEFINYLISDEAAHPYDGLVAGSVA